MRSVAKFALALIPFLYTRGSSTEKITAASTTASRAEQEQREEEFELQLLPVTDKRATGEHGELQRIQIAGNEWESFQLKFESKRETGGKTTSRCV
ncbi:unnamed protein product, partial [Amoebophrya sp. A25]|eukprot:GSA25T00019196001.1